MNAFLLMLQAISQNIALFCCALFAGGSAYISLVEDPAIAQVDSEFAGPYAQMLHPRPAVFLATAAGLGAVMGIVHGIAGGAIWWSAGGLLLGSAALMYLVLLIPEARRLARGSVGGDAQTELRARMRRWHAALTLSGLAALAIFIVQT